MSGMSNTKATAAGQETLNPVDFAFVRERVRALSGIVLGDDKQYLLRTRLGPVMQRHQIRSLCHLVEVLRQKAPRELEYDVIEALTTNETYFFRDIHPFETLRDHILPDLIRRRAATRELSIWCAASSSGQEPYSIAMILRENFPELANWRVRLIATDISAEMVQRARAGEYTQLEVNRGLPIKMLLKWFEKSGERWRLRPEIRSMVEYQTFNLTQTWLNMPIMDVMFIRNVLIYFDEATKKEVFRQVRAHLQPDGYVFLGTSETTLSIDDELCPQSIGKSVCYRIRSGA